MKIKKRDLIQIIREMAYMGIPNIQTGQTTHLLRGFPENSKKAEKINYFFKSKNWYKRAQSFSSAFPNSNVWVIPQIGDIESEELQFDKEEPRDGDMTSYSNRGNIYNINKNLLRSLGMPEEVISGVRLTQDIIFVPRVWRWQVAPGAKIGAGNFDFPTPHMIVHALFDGGALFNLPEVKRAESIVSEDPKTGELIAIDVLRNGIIKYVISGIDPDNFEIDTENFESDSNELEVDTNNSYLEFLQNESFTGMKAPITASLRSGDIDMAEVLHEILTGCLLYNRLEKIEVSEKLDKWIRDQTGMSVKELLSSAVKASREFLKGKIVIVNI